MQPKLRRAAAWLLLVFLFAIAGSAALRESVTLDEVAHIGAGLSYLQRLDLRLNAEHPPLGKVIVAVPLALRGTAADYSAPSWKLANTFFPAYMTQWMFGDAVVGRWNPWRPTLFWARLPMLLLTLWLGWLMWVYGRRLGGDWGGLLCLSAYVTTPAILVFGPLVLTDLPVTLFSLVALWRLGEMWVDPSPRQSRLFGLALGAALLSKFTGLLLLVVIPVLFIHSRFWPTRDEPRDRFERKQWRRNRWRAVGKGVLWALLAVYVVYFVLSWNQPNDALDRIQGGWWAAPLRRVLMPGWLYVRGLLLMLVMGSRSTFLLGRSYSHGVPFYFPVVFALKSTLGFLALLALSFCAVWLLHSSQKRGVRSVIPATFQAHWRVLQAGFWTFLIVCLLSRLDISIRHFMMPIALMILMLAPLPNILQVLPGRRFWQTATVALVACCFVAILASYPNLFPFVNSLAFGRPSYQLVNDSNVSWNGGLPAVEEFVRERKLPRIALDWAALSDPTMVVPEAEAWDCQAPLAADAGQWAVVASVSILENRDCSWLQAYPHQALAGGEFYAFQLPRMIPEAGMAGGPPPLSRRRLMWGVPFDIRAFAVDVERHPDKLPGAIQQMMQNFQKQNQQGSRKAVHKS